MDINTSLVKNIELLKIQEITRAFISQNLLSQARNLVEHVAVKSYGQGKEIEANWDTIKAAQEFIKGDEKYLFLRRFHRFLQESSSHYTPDEEGAERLMMKYYQYFLMLKNFVKKEFEMDLLQNIELFPIDNDKTIENFHKKIVERINIYRQHFDFRKEERLYVNKIVPFVVDNDVYYEMVLSPAYDTTSKFDRFIVYSKKMIPSYYSIKAAIVKDVIEIDGRFMPISILTDYDVSIRPCELKNFAKILGFNIKIDANHAEYTGMMNYLTISAISLLDIINMSDRGYYFVKSKMFERAQVHRFEIVLDECREIIKSDVKGSNVLRYLLSSLNNKVIKDQYSVVENEKLSNLCLNYGCIPFDSMPYASSLIRHNPTHHELIECIDTNEREHEFIARRIHNNMRDKGMLYTPKKELSDDQEKVNKLINVFNSNIYYKHHGRKIVNFGDKYYVKSAYDDTKNIMEYLISKSSEGLAGYENAITAWINENKAIDSIEKRDILKNMFSDSSVTLLYGAAGTGKTYLINLLSQFMDSHSKLCLANTNPAVDNLKRNIKAQNCTFMTIKKFVMTRNVQCEYDILIMDECSMCSNEDMAKVLKKIDCKLLLLVGDIYQIESISFGNWFSLAKFFVPEKTCYELNTPYRTKDGELLKLWDKVRKVDNDLTEYIVRYKYSTNLNNDVLKKESDDEIILCLNYDGLYGINNINRFLQENNANKAYSWGLWTFKEGDPILFNESERFAPLLYNNLKGKIVAIEEDKNRDRIWFSIELDKAFTALDVMDYDIELLEEQTPGKSIVKFYVRKKEESDEDNSDATDADIPFQIAYAVSIHKAQGLEYDSVKVIITSESDEKISHNIFYTAITRTRRKLKIFWSPESQEKVINSFEVANIKNDATIFAGQSKLKMIKKKRKKQ